MRFVLQRRQLVALPIFAAGLAFTIFLVQSPPGHAFFDRVGQSGYLGALFAGVLYGNAFAASAATVMFAHLADSQNHVLLAVIGGAGSMLYDLSALLFTRHELHLHPLGWLNRWREHHTLPTWLIMLVGLVILGSPLPDELAAGLMGALHLRTGHFIILSLLANMAGIFFIASLG